MNRRALFSLSFGHFTADLNSGTVTALLPLLSTLFALNYQAAAVAVLVSNLTSSVVQPLFGVITDRYPMRWLLPTALGVAALGTSAFALAPTYNVFLVLVAVAGIGVAAFHPIGASGAFSAAGDRRASAMSIFSVGGNIGFAFGPLIAAAATHLYGLRGMLVFLVPGAIAVTVLGRYARTSAGAAPRRTPAGGDIPWLMLSVLVFVVVLRSTAQFGVMTFFPLYLSRSHILSPALSGGVLFFFLIMGALGTLAGGPISDRFGRRTLLVLSWVFSTPLLYLLPRLGGVWQFAALGLLGFFIVTTFSTTVVLAQELLPGRQGVAASLTIGLAIGLGGVVMLFLGQYADRFGVRQVLDVLWLLGLFALAGSLPLPNKEPEPHMAS
ncbi:MAG: MFS transporter [Thermaerobacter sp.]|nr:MFS transporter [Thermaerobacter sp.]